MMEEPWWLVVGPESLSVGRTWHLSWGAALRREASKGSQRADLIV